MNLAPYRKSIAALVGAVLTWLTASLTDNAVSTPEWIALGVAVSTALGVYGTPNEAEADRKPFKRTDKGTTGVGVALAVAVLIVVLLLGFGLNHLFFLLLIVALLFLIF